MTGWLRNPLRKRRIIGQRTVNEDVMFFYDRLAQPTCIHGVSVYKPCATCARAGAAA